MIIQSLESGWREKIEPKIKEVLDQIDSILAQPTEEAKYKKYYEYYPQKQAKPTIDMSKVAGLFGDLE
jgi:hypothetical protein